MAEPLGGGNVILTDEQLAGQVDRINRELQEIAKAQITGIGNQSTARRGVLEKELNAVLDEQKRRQEARNYQKGTARAREIQESNNPFLYAGSAIKSGMDSAGAGVQNALRGITGIGGPVATPPGQYEGQTIMNGLAENGKGAGYYAYGTLNTVGNMLPSMAAGVISPKLGLAVMGAEAGGNAYGEAIREGYSENRALTYGALVGASEALLEKVLGGISALRTGTSLSGRVLERVSKLDNVLTRIALSGAVSIGSEVTEEELQNWLEPVFRTAILKEDFEAPTGEEMLETAIITALSTGLVNAPGAITREVSRVKSDLNSLERAYAPETVVGEPLDNGKTNGYHDGEDQNGMGGTADERDSGGLLRHPADEGVSPGSPVQGPQASDAGGDRTVLQKPGSFAPETGEVGEWAKGHVVDNLNSKETQIACDIVRQYGFDASVVEDKAFREHSPSADAQTSEGHIYFSDAIPEGEGALRAYHELIHAAKQNGNEEYIAFLGDTIAYVDSTSPMATQILNMLTNTRINGLNDEETLSIYHGQEEQGDRKSFAELSASEAYTVLDELNSIVWGFYKDDPDNAREQFGGMFKDFDQYIRDLDDIMEQLKPAPMDQSVLKVFHRHPKGEDARSRQIVRQLQTAAERQREPYAKMGRMLMANGIVPTNEMLEAMGMSREEAQRQIILNQLLRHA